MIYERNTKVLDSISSSFAAEVLFAEHDCI